MSFLGGSELIVLLIVGLLVFGSSRLPAIARSLREARQELVGVVEAHPVGATEVDAVDSTVEPATGSHFREDLPRRA